jgi:type II secretory pathway component PulK
MKRGTDGSILILSLWVLFFLAALTVASAGHVWAVLHAAERLQERVAARLAAGSAAAWAAAMIEDLENRQDRATNLWDGASADAWNRDEDLFLVRGAGGALPGRGRVYFALPGEDVRHAGVLGEEGRIHLNRGHPDWIRNLFAYVGGEQGRLIAEQLLSRPRESDVGLTEYGANAYNRASFGAVEDLLLVEGVDAVLYDRIAPHVTVFGRGDRINVNSASRSVLVAHLLSRGGLYPEAEAERIADAVVSARSQRGFEGSEDFRARLDGVPGDILSMGLGVISSKVFRGIAVGGGEPGPAVLEIEFVWDRESRRFVFWRER